MSPVTLYKKQREILDYISQYIQQNGTSPTLKEIADAMNLSSLATVHEHLQALEKKGMIRRFDGAVRGIEVVDESENPIDTILVSQDLVSKVKRSYVLQVRGDSMINEGIFNGDYVVIQQQNTADNGDIVVALIDNNFATLKSFFREKDGRIRLQPANDKMDPIYVEPKNLSVQGKVTGVIRKYS